MAIDLAKPKPAAKAKAPALAKAASKDATPTRSPVSAAGPWRVQLGAFSARGSAESLFRTLSKSPALAGRQAYYIPAGKVTRLQAGPFESRAAAAAACARLAPQACFPVEGR